MANFFSLNAALPQTSNVHRDHNSFSEPQRPPFEYEPEPRHKPRPSMGRSRTSDTGPAFPQAMPAPYNNGAHRESSVSGGRPQFDLGRSPPNASNKNTKHVPCKFFRQGQCQAGNACPFSHTLDPVAQTQPCKYFQKGNCKFGAKCALLHIYPDGTIANRPGGTNAGRNGRGFSSGQHHPPPPPFLNQDAQLSNSLLTQQRQFPLDPYTNQYHYPEQDEGDAFYDRLSQYRNGPGEGGIASPPGSHFGSPLEESQFSKSPVENIRTALNAPLPQSFDPNGLSHFAKYGPLGHSVPDKFGMKSPPASLPKQRGLLAPETSTTNRPGPSGSTLRNGLDLGSSPLQTQDEPTGQRLLHSQRNARSNRLSASVPQGNPLDDWDENFTFEQELLPNSVRDEVLTPQEKMRRLSRPDQDAILTRDQTSGLAIPSGSSSKVGSPSIASSPSRYRAIFEQQQQQRERKEQEGANGFSSFGHVGSPLRESWMPNGVIGASPNTLSGISQQMARMQLNPTDSSESNAASSSNRLYPAGTRHSSAPVGRFERPGLASPGISSTRIDEEVEGLVFSMDDWGGRSPRLNALDANVLAASSRPINIENVREETNGSGGKAMFGFR